MGVKELTKRLGPAIRNVNINVSCKDQRVGVDAAVWLHEFSIGCADQVVRRQEYSGVVARFCARVAYLHSIGIVPVIVFDGAACPAKAGTDAARARKRAEAYARVESADELAGPCSATDVRAAISVTWDMKSN